MEEIASFALDKLVEFLFRNLKEYFDPRLVYRIRRKPVHEYSSYMDFWCDLLGPRISYSTRKTPALKEGDIVALDATITEWVPTAPGVADMIDDAEAAREIAKSATKGMRNVHDVYSRMGVTTVRLLPHHGMRLLSSSGCRWNRDYGFAHLGVPTLIPESVFQSQLSRQIREHGAAKARLIGRVSIIPGEIQDRINRILPQQLRDRSPVRQVLAVDSESHIRDVRTPDYLEGYAWTVASSGKEDTLYGEYFSVDPSDDNALETVVSRMKAHLRRQGLKAISEFDELQPSFWDARLKPFTKMP